MANLTIKQRAALEAYRGAQARVHSLIPETNRIVSGANEARTNADLLFERALAAGVPVNELGRVDAELNGALAAWEAVWGQDAGKL